MASLLKQLWETEEAPVPASIDTFSGNTQHVFNYEYASDKDEIYSLSHRTKESLARSKRPREEDTAVSDASPMSRCGWRTPGKCMCRKKIQEPVSIQIHEVEEHPGFLQGYFSVWGFYPSTKGQPGKKKKKREEQKQNINRTRSANYPCYLHVSTLCQGLAAKGRGKQGPWPWSLPRLKWVFFYPWDRAWVVWNWGVARKTTMTFVYYHQEPGREDAPWRQSSEVYYWIERFLKQLQLQRSELTVLNGVYVHSCKLI